MGQIWKTKTGEEIDVLQDMTPYHAANVLDMLVRTNDPNVLLNALLMGKNMMEAESKKRAESRTVKLNGDIAQDHHDMYMNEVFFEDEEELGML